MGNGILLFGNHPPPFGGVPAHIQYLAPYLADKGWNVHVLSMEGNKTWDLNCTETMGGYTVHRPSKALRLSKLLNPSLYPKCTEALGSYRPQAYISTLALANYVKDLVVQHEIKLISAYHIFGAGLVSAMVCNDFSIPLITTVFGEIYAQPEYHKKHLDAVRYVVNTSCKILSCSEHCASSFKVLDLYPEAKAVYYGIDIAKFHPDNDGQGIRNRLGIKGTDRVFIFVARMVREMGLHVLLAAIPSVIAHDKGVRLIIVGKSGELLPMAQEIATNYPQNIFVIPDAPFEELPLYYAAATVAVIPSVNDRACLGLAIAEAMATGKPAIVSDIGGGPEVIVPGVTGYLVTPDNSKALADSMVKVLLTDEAQLQEIGRQGRDRAVAIFNKDETNRKMEALFLEVMS